jgi:hypothetical protein
MKVLAAPGLSCTAIRRLFLRPCRAVPVLRQDFAYHVLEIICFERLVEVFSSGVREEFEGFFVQRVPG